MSAHFGHLSGNGFYIEKGETHNSKPSGLKFYLTCQSGMIKLAVTGGWLYEEGVGCFVVFDVCAVLCGWKG